MKLTRSFIATIITALLVTGTICYTSCKKDRCHNVVCLNGGSCANGYCSCPTGFSGDNCEISNQTEIDFTNNTFTDIKMVINSQQYIIPSGQTKGFFGGYGDTLKANALTSGIWGETVYWDTLAYVYPQRDETPLAVSLDVKPTYFYLFVKNDSGSCVISQGEVNKGLPTGDKTYINYNVYNDGGKHGIGYFLAFGGSNVYLTSYAPTSRRDWTFTNLGLSGLNNQWFTADATP